VNDIKQVKKELNAWSRHQSLCEQGDGFASKSNVEAIRQHILSGGCRGAGEYQIPDYLYDIDAAISRLSEILIKAIRCRYILKLDKSVLRSYGYTSVKQYNFLVAKAENALLFQQ